MGTQVLLSGAWTAAADEGEKVLFTFPDTHFYRFLGLLTSNPEVKSFKQCQIPLPQLQQNDNIIFKD